MCRGTRNKRSSKESESIETIPSKPPCQQVAQLVNLVVVGFRTKSFRSFILQANWLIKAYVLSLIGIEQEMLVIID